MAHLTLSVTMGIVMSRIQVRVSWQDAMLTQRLPLTLACRMIRGCGRHCRLWEVVLGAAASMMLTALSSYSKRASAPLKHKESRPIRSRKKVQAKMGAGGHGDTAPTISAR